MPNTPQHIKPPRRADAFLDWYCSPALLEVIQGDLHELFYKRMDRYGLWQARLIYWLDVIRFIRPYVLHREKNHQTARGPIMLTGYLKLALRTMRRQKGYTLINTLGLSIGMCCCVLIALYVDDELGYDRFHEHADRIYRLLTEHQSGAVRPIMSYRVAEWVVEDYPEINRATRVFKHWEQPLLARTQESFVEQNFFFADSAFFDVFSYNLLQGDPQTVLNAPLSVVLSQSAARKYFGQENPIGQTLRYNTNHELTVTGVMEDVPRQSHMHPDFVASITSLPQVSYARILQEWGVFYTYVVVQPSTDPAVLENKLADLFDRRFEAQNSTVFQLQPLTTIHLHSHLDDEIEANGDIRYVYLLSALGILILLIACINYMNLATARSVRRAREVGLRKVVGAHRTQLIGQFLAEAVFLSALALIVAWPLIHLALPLLNAVTGKALGPASGMTRIWVGAVGIGLGVGLLAGSYPALFLSRFRPAQVLKGALKSRTEGRFLRKGLVVTQFTASVVLIVGTLIVFQQLQFLRTTRLGFDREHVVVIRIQDQSIQQNYEALRAEWLRNPNVLSVGTTSSAYPGLDYSSGHRITREGAAEEEGLSLDRNWVDKGYFETLGITFAAGRGFTDGSEADRDAVVLNEAAMRRIGWTLPESVPGRIIRVGDRSMTVIGVVRDFHFKSLHHQIEPLFFSPSIYPTYTLVRIRPDDMAQTISDLQRTWERFATQQPYSYTFLDETFDALYSADAQWGYVIGYASALAVFIACLGLLGLAAYTAEQRRKEMGVRKVLGATVPHMTWLMLKDITRLVLIAYVAAVPISYLLMNRWLTNFAYHVEVSVWVFLVAGLSALLIAVLTVGYQSVRTALTNPVDTLRYEG